jgi:hypothetical protein
MTIWQDAREGLRLAPGREISVRVYKCVDPGPRPADGPKSRFRKNALFLNKTGHYRQIAGSYTIMNQYHTIKVHHDSRSIRS